MAEFPIVDFSGDGGGLFSGEEIRRLMGVECTRAERYGYPVAAMMIAVDRLEQLGDLYGTESRDTILDEVSTALERNTRESDLLGFRIGSHFFALFPHTARKAALGLARRLIGDTGKLTFDEGSASVSVTLSIGLAFRGAGEAGRYDLDELRSEVTTAVLQAISAGGDRAVAYTPPKDVPQVPDLKGNLDELGKSLETLLAQKVAAIFESMGQSLPDFGGHRKEVLALAVEKMELAHEQMRREHAERVDLLERRLAKVSQSLELTEGELRRALLAKGVDPGVASIYRTVQGLSDVEHDLELKREMMAAIFEANLELRTQLSERTGRGSH
ncbi:MAG: GGDEF domain-containing protein [Planctomycetes bacterium]|nr:GGDEF domain-containing protein [Planctomycetota bacterium]